MSNDTAPPSTPAESEDLAARTAAWRATEGTADFNPFGNPAATEKHRLRREADEAIEAREKRWRPHLYSLESLTQSTRRWARRAAERVEQQNASRDMRYPSTVTVDGADLVKFGATDEELLALMPLSPAGLAALKEAAAVEHEAAKLRIRDRARRLVAGESCTVEPPAAVSLTDLLAVADVDQTYRIDRLLPGGGNVLLAAQYKAGKSTLIGNAIRALVDGGRFLGTFTVEPVAKVVLIDTELDESMLRRWLRDQNITNTGAVSVVALRGRVSTFDILDPQTRAEWAQRLGGADVVILDCLRPVLDALGLSEDKDAGRILVAFDALKAEIGATEAVVVTHMGHQNERARGDSRLLDWPDALWKIVRGTGAADDAGQFADARYFSALGRDVDLGEGRLSFDPATRHLTYEGGSRAEAAALHALPELVALVQSEPGTLSKNDAEKRLRTDHGIPQKAARAAIKRATAPGGALGTIAGARGAHMLTPRTGDPFALPESDE